jgi:hypothetical protein
MITCNPRSLAFALLVSLLPMGLAFAGGAGGRGGGGVLGGGVGAAGVGSAAVGGGAPAGRVGGGPTAGAVGGGLPGSMDPGGNGSAGTGNPSLNALGAGSAGTGTNAPGIPTVTTNSGAIGGYGGPTGVAATPNLPGGISPAALHQEGPSGAPPTVPKVLQGTAEEQAQLSTTGLAIPGPDGVSTVIVAPRPCGVAAHETDGTTTCVGIPSKRRR